MSRFFAARPASSAGLVITAAVCVAVAAGARAEAPARVMLDQAVARALARNPTVAVAIAEIDRADALLRQARAASYPSLFGNAVYTRLEGNRYSAPGVKTASQDQIAANVTLTVPLVAPAAWAQTWHAGDNRRIAEDSAVDVRRQLAVAAAR